MLAKLKSWALMALAAVGAFLGLTAYVYRQQRDDARADASQARAEQQRQEREYDRRLMAHAAEMEAERVADEGRAEVATFVAGELATNKAAAASGSLADRINGLIDAGEL